MADKNDEPPKQPLKLVPPLPDPEKSNLAQFSDARAIKQEEFERVEKSVVFYSSNGIPVLTINKVACQEMIEEGQLEGFWSISTESDEKGFFIYAVGVDQDGNIVSFREEYRKKKTKRKRSR